MGFFSIDTLITILAGGLALSLGIINGSHKLHAIIQCIDRIVIGHNGNEYYLISSFPDDDPSLFTDPMPIS